ncbi:Heterokaryon incompatibility protein 6,OR allele [Lachnellula hyalina]|uniref:Heterokaryon incompatibility protein 6,OR allele n=1 Tax=Lachnellula hyalina TaxID=1316788 RepID=A0A8H8TZL6_9HELO|nr:Heterokaryon incompatibility protein 6,OR allele [Lachnellula hyalina]TVY26485.1 Heterokaryon incompatibility protein 6,OR allele [Lachnellula hyalina]
MPLPHKRMIRLLYLDLTTGNHSTIHSKLQPVNFDESCVYKALSYVWGDEGEQLPIFIDGKRHWVTPNCRAALRRLREIGVVCLWVDAICINQRDESEKRDQLALMRDIYHFADEVVIWLGYSELEAKRDRHRKQIETLAFALIRVLDSKANSYMEDSIRLLVQGSKREPAWRALGKILMHKWFERLWTYQELLVAAKASFVFQYYHIAYDKVLNPAMALWEFLLQHDYINTGPLPNLRPALLAASRRSKAWRCYDRDSGQLRNRTLLDVLQDTLHLECSNPKDRVFAIMGLVKDRLNRTIRLDYGQSVATLYTMCALEIIEENESLEVLSLAGIDDHCRRNRDALPSWVPDWQTGAWERTIPVQHGLYKAASNSTPIQRYLHDHSTLEAHGFHVDTICREFSLQSRSYSYGLADWCARFEKYPNGDSEYHAWVRTITLDRSDHSTAEFSRLPPDIFQQYVELSQLPRRPGEDRKSHRYYRTIRSAIKSRKFILSKSGYMGLGPLATETNDMICVLRGCNVPVVIREEHGHHLFIGACFVWGLMDGEVIKHGMGNGREMYVL